MTRPVGHFPATAATKGESCYRSGGETVYVRSKHFNGVTEAQSKAILSVNPKAKGWGWRTLRRNPGVYVKGRV